MNINIHLSNGESDFQCVHILTELYKIKRHIASIENGNGSMNAKRTAGSPKHTSIKQIFSSRYNFYFLSNFILAIWPLFCSRFVFEIECWSQPFLFLILSLNFFSIFARFFSRLVFLKAKRYAENADKPAKNYSTNWLEQYLRDL